MISGILIGLGDLCILKIENKYISAFLFSLALLAIIKNGFSLFTGRIGFLNLKTSRYINILSLNALFCLIVTCTASSEFPDKLSQMGWAEVLNGAIFCGILIQIAVVSKNELITVMCVMAFILCGFQHCIAVFPYMVFNFSWPSFWKWVLCVIGNSCGAIAAQSFVGMEVYEKAKKIF